MFDEKLSYLQDFRGDIQAFMHEKYGVQERGDAEKAITRAQKGELAEREAAETMRRAGYTQLESKLARNNGFDGVWVKRNADGEITDIIITESKYSSTGTATLTNTKTMGQQMSAQWIDANIAKMLQSENASVRETGQLLLENRGMIRGKLRGLGPAGAVADRPQRRVQHRAPDVAALPDGWRLDASCPAVRRVGGPQHRLR
ncbi:MAG: hypothetical protein QM783_07315 [Phycisphaerales bacterium]